MTPQVSVVIPLYNKAATIARSVRSVAEQTLRDIELIIVDDGSTDGSAEAIPDDTGLSLKLVSQANAGPGAARNAGAQHAQAPRLAFLDADDEWDPDFLDVANQALDTHSDAALYMSNFTEGPSRTLRSPSPDVLGIREGLQEMHPPEDPALLKSAVDAFCSSAIVVDRAAFNDLGGFYERNRCLYGEDSYLWLQAYITRPFVFDPEPRIWFHTEDSDLGARRLGRHPKRPALSEPDLLRANCTSAQQRKTLDTLLAYYRLLETEKNRALRSDTIPALRRAFPWPDGRPRHLLRRETKVTLRALAERFGIARPLSSPLAER